MNSEWEHAKLFFSLFTCFCVVIGFTAWVVLDFPATLATPSVDWDVVLAMLITILSAFLASVIKKWLSHS